MWFIAICQSVDPLLLATTSLWKTGLNSSQSQKCYARARKNMSFRSFCYFSLNCHTDNEIMCATWISSTTTTLMFPWREYTCLFKKTIASNKNSVVRSSRNAAQTNSWSQCKFRHRFITTFIDNATFNRPFYDWPCHRKRRNMRLSAAAASTVVYLLGQMVRILGMAMSFHWRFQCDYVYVCAVRYDSYLQVRYPFSVTSTCNYCCCCCCFGCCSLGLKLHCIIWTESSESHW